MRNYRHAIIIAFVAMSASCIFGQDIENKTRDEPAAWRTMQIRDTVFTRLDAIPMLSPLKCDAEGNIYIRPNNLGARFGWNEVLKFSPTGERKATFTMPSELLAKQYFIANDGVVFVLAEEEQKSDPLRNKPEVSEWKRANVFLVEYEKDGNLKRKTKLDSDFFPSGSFVIFPSGQMLISATEAPKQRPAPPSNEPFTALFDSKGQLLLRITAKDDAWITEAVEAGDEKKIVPGKGRNPAITKGQAVIGSDGNAYILRATSPAVIFVISNAGAVIRTLALPSGDPPLFPSIMFENKGQLALVFQEPGQGGRERIRIFNSSTGDVIETATVEPPLGAAVACFTPPQFTFLREKDGKFVFYLAEPR